jgi:hypothetical protein
MSMPPTKPTLPVLVAAAASLVLLEDHRLHVGQVDHRVDDGEARVGKFLGDLLEGRSLGEADAEHGVRAALRHLPEGLLALGFVGDLELPVLDAGLLAEPLDAVVDALVEGLVELAAHVEDDRRLELRRLGAAQGEAEQTAECQEVFAHPVLPVGM